MSAASIVLVVLGAVLVLAGLGLTVWQMFGKERQRPLPSRRLSAHAGPVKFDLQTTFPGLIVIGFGVVLLVIGAATN